MKITRQNYKQFAYISDYRTDEFKNASVDQLRAQRFYLTDIYGGMVGPYGQIRKLALSTLRARIKELLKSRH